MWKILKLYTKKNSEREAKGYHLYEEDKEIKQSKWTSSKIKQTFKAHRREIKWVQWVVWWSGVKTRFCGDNNIALHII